MLDVPKCLAKTRLDTDDFTFNLQLSDPIEEHLEDGNAWRGVAGDYVVTLGRQSSARHGTEASLPTLCASVGAFTRVWLGVRSASVLARTDDLRGDADLLLRPGPGAGPTPAARPLGLLKDSVRSWVSVESGSTRTVRF